MDIEILILAQLMHGSKHGYEIKKNIIFVMGNPKIINNNALYPKLKQFEERGLVIQQIEVQERRPNRIVYSITPSGLDVFYRSLREFTPETIKSDNEWCIRLAYYDLLDQETRRRLISYREEYMKERSDRLEELVIYAGNNINAMYSQELYLYNQHMLEREREILKGMIDNLEVHDTSSSSIEV